MMVPNLANMSKVMAEIKQDLQYAGVTTVLTQDAVHNAADEMAARFQRLTREFHIGYPRVYPIPRGGVPVAYLLQQRLPISIVDDPNLANMFVDDLIDSGATAQRWRETHPKVPFLALYDKRENPELGWVVFPWEGDIAGSIEDSTIRLLQFIGEDPSRGGLLETPGRVSRAWKDWTSGYSQDPATILKVFEDGGEQYDEMVIVRNIPFYSHCEHHLAPFFGTADIAYIPNGKIVGLSKLPRLLNVFARRLQVQERLTAQVADSLMEHLGAKGAAVSIRARHLCMESRGIERQGSETVTNVLRGVFKENAAARAEFLASVK